MIAQPMNRLLRPVREWINRTSNAAGTVVREMVGRVSYTYQANVRGAHLSVDKTMPDYVFWDKFRRGKARGNEISGLFGQRIVETITAFELGGGVTMTLDVNDDEVEDSAEARNLDAEENLQSSPQQPEVAETPRIYTDRLLDRFCKRNLAQLVTVEQDKLALGDQYVVVNADGTLTVVSPDTVEIEHDPLDYRRITKIKVTTHLEKHTVVDEYTAEKRTVTTKELRMGAKPVVETYANLIGRIPVVHVACGKGANELYGHPIYEALFRVFSRYDDLIEKALDGVELLGNPIPVFTGVADVLKMLEDNGVVDTEEFLDPLTNTTGTRKVLALDRLPVVILGIGADMKMVAPDKGFTTDIEKMLQTLFLLVCFHVSVPEYVFGGGMNASRASIETQFPPFAKFIESRRLQLLGEGADDFLNVTAKGGLYELVDLWLRMRQLTDPRVIVAPTKAIFPEITPEDANIAFQKVVWADGTGKLKQQTALEKLRLVSDPAKEIEEAQAEAAEREQFDYRKMINQAAHQETDPSEQTPETDTRMTKGKPPLPGGGRRPRMDNGTPVGEMAADDPAVLVLDGGKRRRRRKPKLNGKLAADVPPVIERSA